MPKGKRGRPWTSHKRGLGNCLHVRARKMLQTSRLTSNPHGTKPEGRQEERMREPATRKKDEPSHSFSAQGTQPNSKEPEARKRGAPSRSLMAQGQSPNTRKRPGRGPKKMRHLHEAPPEVRAAKEDIRAKARKAHARNSTQGSCLTSCQGRHPCESQEGTCT